MFFGQQECTERAQAVRIRVGWEPADGPQIGNTEQSSLDQRGVGQSLSRALQRIVYANRKDNSSATLKDIATDVQLIKEFLRTNIGTTYAAATQQSNDNLLSVDMSDWGGRAYPRANAPFQQLRNAQNGYREYVQNQLQKLCPWQRWS